MKKVFISVLCFMLAVILITSFSSFEKPGFLKNDDNSSCSTSGSSVSNSLDPDSSSSSSVSSLTSPTSSEPVDPEPVVTTAPVVTAPPVDPDEPFYDLTFVYYEDGIQYRSVYASKVPNNTRGFFMYNGFTYFCIKADKRDGMLTWLDISSFDYGGYTYCLLYTEDMENFTDYTDLPQPEFGPALSNDTFIVYLKLENVADPVALNFELIENLEVVLQVCDPANPEAPS